MRRSSCGAALFAAAAMCVAAPVAAAQQSEYVQASVSAQDLKRLSIEELTAIDVTSVSRRVERLSETAAAVSVVRGEDIRRSGYSTLADAIRLGDAMDVARVNSSTWGVSARGFNTNPANKLLVLIDGRSVYSPLSSGTFWDAQDLVLDNVDRIEVIRGPGGSVWGANAVNGVINIISKEAAATRGTYMLLATGSDEHAIGSLRHGGRLGATGSYRVHGKYRRRGAQVFATGVDADDPVQMGLFGFRLESGTQGPTRWTVQGDLYRGAQGFPDRPDGNTSGGNVLAQWSRRFSSTSEFQVQSYYDRTTRHVPNQFDEARDTFDLDLQHQALFAGRHSVVAGGNFRVSRGDDKGIAGFFFDPQERTDTLFSVFVQDEIALVPRRFYVTLGSKFERNDFTGVEVQPTLRARWSPDDRQTLWGAVSRAVRLPTRFDTDLRILGPGGRLFLTGTPDFGAEEVVALEGGYRVRPHARLAVDVAAFMNRYDNLRSTEVTGRGIPFIELGNRLNADANGIEIAATVQPFDPWRVHGSYAFLDKTITFDPGSNDFYRGAVEGNDPAHLFALRSYLDLPGGFELDAIYRHTGRRPAPAISPYDELNLRLGWTVRAGWELSLIGQNLLHEYHPELSTAGGGRFAFRRGVYARSAWRF